MNSQVPKQWSQVACVKLQGAAPHKVEMTITGRKASPNVEFVCRITRWAHCDTKCRSNVSVWHLAGNSAVGAPCSCIMLRPPLQFRLFHEIVEATL